MSTLVVIIIALLPLVSLLGGRVMAITKGGFWIGEPQLMDIVRTLKHSWSITPNAPGLGRGLLRFLKRTGTRLTV